MTAGWIRIVGQITAMAMCSDVTSEGAPMTSQERTLALLVVPGMEMIGDPQGLQANSFSLFGLLNQLYRALSHSPLMSSISWYPNMVTCQRMSTPSRGLYSNSVTSSRFTMVRCTSSFAW